MNSFPEKNLNEIITIEKKYFKYLCNLIFEIIKMPLISKKDLEKRFKFKNLNLIEDRLQNGESVIACTAHYGNWEWGMLAFGLKLSKIKYVIYKPLSNDIFDKWFFDMRSRFGNTPIPMKQTLRTVASSRNITSVLCFASDQTPLNDPANYWMNFLNQPTAVFSGPEKIAVQTNRPVFYLKLKVIKKGYYEVECIPIHDQPKTARMHEITEAQFAILATNIKAEPQYWLWSHRRWKHKQEIK